jgi:hypothetical protein
MLTKILLPHRYQKIGWIALFPFTFLLLSTEYFEFTIDFLTFDIDAGGPFSWLGQNFTNEIGLIGVFVSLFLIAFSKEKEEDEFIQKLRLDSLLIACYVHTFILIIGTMVFYGLGYLEFMGYNMFTIQLIFIARFRWALYREQKSLKLA